MACSWFVLFICIFPIDIFWVQLPYTGQTTRHMRILHLYSLFARTQPYRLMFLFFFRLAPCWLLFVWVQLPYTDQTTLFRVLCPTIAFTRPPRFCLLFFWYLSPFDICDLPECFACIVLRRLHSRRSSTHMHSFTLASAFASLVSLHDLSVTKSSTDSTFIWLFSLLALLAAMLWQDALATVKGILVSFYSFFRWSVSPKTVLSPVQLAKLSGPCLVPQVRVGIQKPIFTILALALCLSLSPWHLRQSHLHHLQELSCFDVPFCG